MSEDEFFARWSRRKHEARADAPPLEADPSSEAQQAFPPAAAEGSAAEPEIDLSVLPPIDSITAATDITAFLRKGIPQGLARAALRRAWFTDPAIRNFIGLAENAWDFNDPNAMPGFGPLNCSEAELSALVDRIVGGGRQAAEDLLQSLAKPADTENSVLPHPPAPESNSQEEVADQRAARLAPSEVPSGHAAAQPQVIEETGPVRRRTHGSALPQ
jgi:Protein of unknown function (DUF3306)